MHDSEDDDDNLLHFRLRTKSEKNGSKRQTASRAAPVDVIASGAVIIALIIALIIAVAIVSQWLPFNAYTIGMVACAGAGFIIAKLVKARLPRASGIRFPRNGK
jgi:hypothetical protein